MQPKTARSYGESSMSSDRLIHVVILLVLVPFTCAPAGTLEVKHGRSAIVMVAPRTKKPAWRCGQYGFLCNAAERTRTSTTFRSLDPKSSASANSATAATGITLPNSGRHGGRQLQGTRTWPRFAWTMPPTMPRAKYVAALRLAMPPNVAITHELQPSPPTSPKARAASMYDS